MISRAERRSPLNWEQHSAVMRRRTFVNLNDARRAWIAESNFPEQINKLEKTEHKIALRQMVDMAHKARDKKDFVEGFTQWLSRYHGLGNRK